MTLTSFVRKNAFRNLRRSILTVLSIGFSLLLLTLMMAIWRNFYLTKGTEESALRLVTRHKVSLAFLMPSFYREKIRAMPGVAQVVPGNWFGGKYKDDKSNNFFAQFGTDPEEFFQVYKDWKIPDDQIAAWQHDRAGAVVDSALAEKFHWKLGQKIIIVGTIFPVNLELNIRGFFTAPQPTKTETEKGFQLGFLAMLGNVKAFILSIGGAVVFAILLVSANTMAMSIRERTREVAVLKTLGFTRKTILGLFVGEAVVIALIGGIAGSVLALLIGTVAAKAGGFAGALKVTSSTMLVAWAAAILMGFFSALVPSYKASKLGIVEGLCPMG